MKYNIFRSEGKRTSVKKKTTDPQFHDDFMLNIPVGVPLLECIIRISVWHQTLLADDTFLGQVSTNINFVVIIIFVRSTCLHWRWLKDNFMIYGWHWAHDKARYHQVLVVLAVILAQLG